MLKIKSIEKEDRKDISNYVAELSDGSSVAVEAKTKAEAEKKLKEYLDKA